MMLTTNAALFLPISERLLAPVLDDAKDLGNAITGLAVPQVAALIVLQYLPKLRQTGSRSLDRILLEAIKSGNAQVRTDGATAFTAAVLQVLDREKITAGYRLLADFQVALLDDEEIKQRGYLSIDGEWDSSFRERHRERLAESLQRISLPNGGHGILTAEQSHVFQEVSRQADDHIHVQGYAGTGKSYLIKSLLTMLQTRGAKVLVLAERRRQLDALLGGVDGMAHVYPRTFGTLVGEMVPSDLTDPINRRMGRTSHTRAPIPDESIVRHLSIQPCGTFLPRDIVKVVRSTVVSFCYSGDAEIGANHIPNWCASSLDSTTRQVVLHQATELWKAILVPPSRDFQPPLRGLHRVKWAALNRWRIPTQYTHVLIDECHDLAKPMLQILDGSPQAVISLGDEFQNLHGRSQQRSNVVRQRAVTHSVRSGHLVASVVNPIIAAHPGKTKLPFHGNPLHKTDVSYYDKPHVPERPATILVSDTWGLFEWAQRLSTECVEVELLSSHEDLDMFVKDCVELYLHGTRPRHGELFRFGSWDALATRYHENGGFRRIDRMLRNGYSEKDWGKTAAKLARKDTHGYALGLIEDVRNREFEAVMLIPEVVDRAWDAGHADRAGASSAIYVAVTRARRRLIVPKQLRNWIEQISAHQTNPTRHGFDVGLHAM